VGSLGDEGTRKGVGPIPELDDDRQDAFAHFGSHMGGVIDDPGDRLLRHASSARDVDRDHGR
jgi:hypothetical protein